MCNPSKCLTFDLPCVNELLNFPELHKFITKFKNLGEV